MMMMIRTIIPLMRGIIIKKNKKICQLILRYTVNKEHFPLVTKQFFAGIFLSCTVNEKIGSKESVNMSIFILILT